MRTPRQPDVKTADVALANLAKFFRTANLAESRKAWDVLTALRGPDNATGSHVKLATTAVIRAKFLGLGSNLNTAGLCPRLVAKIGASVFADSPDSAKLRGVVGSDGHFLTHARKAFNVLGLSWPWHNKF